MIFQKSSKKEVKQPAGQISILGEGMTLQGNVETAGDVRIDGTLKGNLRCKARVVLGPTGLIEGDVHCGQADIMGTIEGRVWANESLQLRGDACVTGDIHAAKLVIEPSANFNGQCKMGANVVEFIPETSALSANG